MVFKSLRYRFPDFLVVISGAIIVFIIPQFVSIPTGCLFNKTTGFYCGGCGLSRGLHALLRGDISRAAHQNLMLVSMFPLSMLWFAVRYSDLKNIKSYDKLVISFFVITVVVFTITRNLPFEIFDSLRPY